MQQRKFLFVTVTSIIFVCYQNFSPLSEEDRRTLEVMEELKAMGEEKSSLVAPRSGRDLASVRDDWVDRQGKVWLNGADERLLDTVNARLQSWLGNDEAKEELTSEDVEGTLAAEEDSEPQKFRFATINKVEYKWDQTSLLTCSVEGQGTKLDYSKTWSQNAELGVEHNVSENQTQVLLKYRW
jgi:hypothetical protein